MHTFLLSTGLLVCVKLGVNIVLLGVFDTAYIFKVSYNGS
jgi:hypothetical protein